MCFQIASIVSLHQFRSLNDNSIRSPNQMKCSKREEVDPQGNDLSVVVEEVVPQGNNLTVAVLPL